MEELNELSVLENSLHTLEFSHFPWTSLAHGNHLPCPQTGPSYRRYSNGSSVDISSTSLPHSQPRLRHKSRRWWCASYPRDSRILGREFSTRAIMPLETHVTVPEARSENSTLKTCFEKSEQNGLGKSRRASWGRWAFNLVLKYR